MCVQYYTTTNVQLLTALDRRVVTTTYFAAAALVIDFGDLAVATGGSLILPSNVTLCGGSVHVNGSVSGVRSLSACVGASLSNFTGLANLTGCTNDTNATNYNPLASVNDGSCTRLAPAGVAGCTYPIASNYNPAATVNDGSCTLPAGLIPGCTSPYAINYNASATLDIGSCVYPVPGAVVDVAGCTYSAASNYVAGATVDDGSCLDIVSSDVVANLTSALTSCNTCLSIVDSAGSCDASKGCSPGTVSHQGFCTPCGAGTYSGVNATSCLQCDAGYFGSSPHLTTSKCSGQCVSGYRCPPGTTSPTQFPCPSGQFRWVFQLSTCCLTARHGVWKYVS